MSRPKIAILIPSFNEEASIPRLLPELRALARSKAEWDFLPVFINDGSLDRTAEVLEREGAQAGDFTWIHLPVNLGIGRAVQTGLKLAVELDADVTLQLDCDGQHLPSEVPKLAASVLEQRCDVAVGSRYIAGGAGNVSSRARQAGTLYFSWLLRVLLGVRILDTTSGFRAFSREVTAFLASHYPDDYPEVQAYVFLARKRFRILEVPVQMREREHGASSITRFRSLYYMIKVTLATLLDRVRRLPTLEERTLS